MTEQFRIAGQNIRITGGRFCRLFSGFETPATYQNDLDECRIDIVAGHTQFDIQSLTPTHEISHIFSVESRPSLFMAADRDYDHATILERNDPDGIMEMVLAALYSHMALRRQVAFVHASLAEVPGVGGVMFVGRSGIGKTTQARLWERYRGATIINGDKVFLEMDETNGCVMAHGSPWCGSSPYKLNASTPLRGVIVLDQAPENSIRRLTDVESMVHYVPHIFLPMWDERLTDRVMGAIGAMMPVLPVFYLSCRPDEEAVSLTYKAVFGNEKS